LEFLILNLYQEYSHSNEKSSKVRGNPSSCGSNWNLGDQIELLAEAFMGAHFVGAGKRLYPATSV
jgi:hypothetical protein